MSDSDYPAFLAVSRERTRDCEHEMKHRKSYLNTGNCFIVRVIKCSNSLSKDYGVSVLGDIQNLTGHGSERVHWTR